MDLHADLIRFRTAHKFDHLNHNSCSFDYTFPHEIRKRISILENRFDTFEGDIALIKGKFIELGGSIILSRGLRTMSIPVPDPELREFVSDRTVKMIGDTLSIVHFKHDLNKLDDELIFAALAFEVERMIREKKIPEDETAAIKTYLEDRGVRVTNNEIAIVMTAVAWGRIKHRIPEVAKQKRVVAQAVKNSYKIMM